MEILNFVRQNLVRYSFDNESLVRLESILRNCSIPEQASFALEGERLTQLDTIQHMFTDDGSGDGVLIRSRFNEAFIGFVDVSTIGNFYGLLLASRAETVLVIDEYFDRLSVRAEQMHYERLEKTFDDNAYLWNLGQRHRYVMSVMPATEKVIDAADRLRCELAGTRLLLAIEHFRLVRDAPPESLSALVQEFLDALPVDPYSIDGFRYLVQDETVNGEWPYLLYSVGEDGVDDNGAVNPDGSVHWSSFKIGEGFDLIFTPPLPDPARPEDDGDR